MATESIADDERVRKWREARRTSPVSEQEPDVQLDVSEPGLGSVGTQTKVTHDKEQLESDRVRKWRENRSVTSNVQKPTVTAANGRPTETKKVVAEPKSNPSRLTLGLSEADTKASVDQKSHEVLSSPAVKAATAGENSGVNSDDSQNPPKRPKATQVAVEETKTKETKDHSPNGVPTKGPEVKSVKALETPQLREKESLKAWREKAEETPVVPEVDRTQKKATPPIVGAQLNEQRANEISSDTQAKSPTVEAKPKTAYTDPKPLDETSLPKPVKPVQQLVDPIDEQRNRLKRLQTANRRRFWAGVSIFVLLPTILAMAYEVFVAVPLYEAQSVVMVSKANGAGDSPMSGLLGAIGGANHSNIGEAFMAQEYVHSQSLLEDLEKELGLITRLSSTEVDPLRRLWTIGVLGINKRSQFRRYVRSSVNVQTGLMTLFVRAPTAEDVVLISETILKRTEQRVNELSDTLYEQQNRQAELAVEGARKYLVDTQSTLTQLQIESGEANLEVRVLGIYENIAKVENELLELETRITEQRLAGRSESFQDELKERLEARIALMRRLLVEASPGSNKRPLNEILLDYERLQLEMEIGQEALSLALAAREQAQERAALGRSQFQVVVPPMAGEIPWRPLPLSIGLIVFLTAISVFSLARLFRLR